jgi:cytochrome c oxidase subunit 2
MNQNNNNNNQQNINQIDPALDSQLNQFVNSAVQVNAGVGRTCKCEFSMSSPWKTAEELKEISKETSALFNRLINGRTSITPAETEIIKRCLVNQINPNRITYLEGKFNLQESDSCSVIAENDLIKPLITEDNINTGMSNMIFNEINLGNLEISIICVLGLGIIAGLYLLNKLLNSDEGFSITSKSSYILFNNPTTKGGLVNKGGYDCDDCCCGPNCSCCCGHQKVEIKEGGSKRSDVPLAWGLYFQDGASPSFEGIVDLHNRIMFYLVVILFGVTWVMISIMRNFNKSENKLVYRYLNHGTLIELIWTVGPALVLVAIAFPSFKLLYLMDEVIDPAMTVKVTGHQWYWEYEYADFLNEENETINFDSYMKDEASLEKGELRMLEVDNPVVLPVDTHIRFIITGADVLHDWAMPSLGLKVDACPGRLNQASVIIERTGHFYGQCSEICGVLHSSMPIKIEAVEVEKFFSWLLEQ